MTKNSRSCIQFHLQEQSYPQPTAMPGIEVTSEELPDLYKNMTLYELKEASMVRGEGGPGGGMPLPLFEYIFK